jgi:hypothetical protein
MGRFEDRINFLGKCQTAALLFITLAKLIIHRSEMQQEITRKQASWKSRKRVSEILLDAAPCGVILPATGGVQKIKGLADGV